VGNMAVLVVLAVNVGTCIADKLESFKATETEIHYLHQKSHCGLLSSRKVLARLKFLGVGSVFN
jgi:hypothetical protein